MRNTVTSKEEILKVSRYMLQKQGCPAVNIRSVAAYCGVSVGSIYNYFDSKTDLLTKTIESVWYEVFHSGEAEESYAGLKAYIDWIYRRMEYGCNQYPEFFTLHTLTFMQKEKAVGEWEMQDTWKHILEGLSSIMASDPKVRKNAFNEQFTREDFANVLLSLMFSAILHRNYNPKAVLEIIDRTIY